MTGLRPLAAGLLAAVVFLAGTAAHAQTDEPEARALSGVLKRIKDAGFVRIGYRENSIPFSFAGAGSAPYGYSIDLCNAIVEDIAAAVGGRELGVRYVRVTSTDRIDQVVQGSIDLECGSTTNNAERRRRVAFSPLIFVAGTRLLVKRGSPVHSVVQLAGRKVLVVAGTTNEAAMRQIALRRVTGMQIVTAGAYPEAYARLAAGEADALGADDVLLAGYLAEKGLRGQYTIVGELLSYEPYGIAFARDDAALAEVVYRSFERLATSRELRWIYNKWFLRALPSGERLAVPMSAELERSFQILGLPSD